MGEMSESRTAAQAAIDFMMESKHLERSWGEQLYTIDSSTNWAKKLTLQLPGLTGVKSSEGGLGGLLEAPPLATILTRLCYGDGYNDGSSKISNPVKNKTLSSNQ
ncbi:uncharacterized protein PG998_000970 [Apiospora kogelbergensis]|uniref:uncharacterized protein n=1 Tax=Apiospora kogelbergensis TaxID=1337665 RepID=UPI0031302A81